MSQFARPESDVAIGLWEDDGGGTTNLFEAINEVTPSDVDFIRSETIELPPGDFTTEETLTTVYVTKLSAIVDPQTDEGFKISTRIANNLANGLPTFFAVELIQDYIDEVLLGKIIALREVGSISNIVTTLDFDLTAEEAAQITDFSNLFFRFQFGIG